MVYTCPFACTPLPRPPRYKRESSRPEGELARSVRLKPANVSPFPQFVLAALSQTKPDVRVTSVRAR